MTNALIELEGLGFSYGTHSVLHDVSLTLNPGERIGIMGPIGSGKTTLLHLIVGLLKPSAGKLRAFGKEMLKEQDFNEVRRKAGLVFQDPDDQLFCPTVIEDVAFGPLNLGKSTDEARSSASEALARVGMTGMAERITHKLSGGEKRLVALATVLAMEPDVLLLDEPTASLDKESLDRITEVLNSLSLAMIVVSHEPEFLSGIATRRVTLRNGSLEG